MIETAALFMRVLRLLRGYWSPLLRSTLLGLGLGLLLMLVPLTTKTLIDQVYPARDVNFMLIVVVGAAVLTLSTNLMGAVRSYFAQTVASEISTTTGLGFFNHIQHLPQDFFETHQVGEVLSRLSDVRAGVSTVTGTIQTLISSGIYLVLVPPFLLVLSWELTALSLIVLPITILISTLGARWLRRFARESAEAGAEFHAYQVEVLTHVGTLKSMSMESAIFARAREQMQRALIASLKGMRAQTVVGALNASLRAVGNGLLMWYAWTLILRGELTLGSFIAFTAFLGYLTRPAEQLAALFASLQTAGVALARMFEYLDLPVEQDPAEALTAMPPIVKRLRGHLSFQGVSFHYDEWHPLLKDIALDLRPGSVTAIVGESGAGKSTLLRLVPRLIEPTSGLLRVDGLPVRSLPLRDLRRQVAAVWQQFSLLRGTVRHNITMGAPESSRADVEDAIETCCLEEFIAGLPRGLDTPVGEWGATLSEGQRQRLALARALVRHAPILLLDEATSNLDSITETRLIDRLLGRRGDQTILMVTHRVDAAARADDVFVLRGASLESHHAERNGAGRYDGERPRRDISARAPRPSPIPE